ncbi:MAG: peptidylprolyl isomerase [Thermoplasmata archaeon]|nr:MAG: peptidylprolyl isomerase [Thermoplasmata archaeon]
MSHRKTTSRKRANPVKQKTKVQWKTFAIIAGVIGVIFIIAGFLLLGMTSNNSSSNNGTTTSNYPVAVIDTSMGTIRVELYTDKMPNTTANFIKLTNDGFYNGLVFHRVIDDFMIQGGGFYPNGTMKKDPYGPIKLETNPEVTHVDGAISMARTMDPNSATSQFFICDGAQHQLDEQYAAFGKVIDGMDVVRAIASVDTTTKYGMSDWPVDDVIINSITIVYPD